MKRLRWRALIVVIAALSIWSAPAVAADWPARPIHIIAPYGPGGLADIIGRIVAERLTTELGQPVVVENRGGAGGMIGSAQVARSDPDGYTLLMAGLATHVIAPAISPNPTYDPIRDFTHIAYIGGPPICWVVTPSSDMLSLDDVLRDSRAGKLAGYASSGVGTLGHLVAEYVFQKAGVHVNHLPYNTAALTDIVAGHVTLGTYTWAAVLGQVQAGSLRAVALSTAQRLADFPNLPTFKELGYDLVASTWLSLTAPKGLPKDITQRLNQAMIKIIDQPDVRRRLDQDAFEPIPMTPEQLVSFYETETARWKPIALASGMKK